MYDVFFSDESNRRYGKYFGEIYKSFWESLFASNQKRNRPMKKRSFISGTNVPSINQQIRCLITRLTVPRELGFGNKK